MDHAWLDSLSEDWVSQPRSAGSPVPSAPSLSNSINSNINAKSSRIPKFNPSKQTWTTPNDSTSPLSERSINDHNVPLSQRVLRRPSKLRGDISNSIRGRQLSRTVSASSTSSVQIHTVQHKSTSLSPKKGSYEIPEWKRRLLQGEVAYGEQRDLFSPAGLESIFQPPPTQQNIQDKAPIRSSEDESVVMPSSPPQYNPGNQMAPRAMKILEEEEEEDADTEAKSRQQPRSVQYTLVDEDGSGFSSQPSDQSDNYERHHLTMQPNDEQPEDASILTSLASSGLHLPNRRTVSGQSDVRNEEFSPVFVARHNTIDGKIDYAALNLPAAELQRRLEQVDEDAVDERREDQNDSSRLYPGDLTTETENFAQDGRFVNLRRGGYSQEGSFQRRPLSPSSLPAIDESAMLPEESMQASTPKELPNVRKTRMSNEFKPDRKTSTCSQAPQTPFPSPAKSGGEKSSGGSPLKLFGNYDTFTNQKLLRRLSQFEGDYDSKTAAAKLSPTQGSTSPGLNEAFVADSSLKKLSKQTKAHHTPRKVTSFGEGDLDSFQFSEEVSYNPHGYLEDESMSLPVLNPSTQTRFTFQLDPSPALDHWSTSHRKEKYTKVTTSKIIQTTTRNDDESRPGTGSSSSVELHSSRRVEDLHTPRKRSGDLEGKRLPKTPLKDPTPKRRRTLHETEIAHTKVNHETSVEQDSLKDTHQQMQSVLGRKRKDARHDDDQQAANPKILAMRQILRPRTPTPSQRSSVQHEPLPVEEQAHDPTERARLVQQQKIAKIQAELDSTDPPKPKMALGASQHMHDDSRKGSVTTQDFLDEAKKIMAGIRGKARSGLASLEESESEIDRNISPGDATPVVEQDDSYQESTQEPFSRPPSREGKPVERPQVSQADPALLDHLRKYQEMSDMDLVVASSMKSIALAKEASIAAKELEKTTQETLSLSAARLFDQERVTESDPPNIRISENPDAQRKRKHSTSSLPTQDIQDGEFPSQGSNGSSDQSTARSIPTGSSRGSDPRRIIAPHTVSHLIPEELAGMIFDRNRNIWFKGKPASGDNSGQNYLPSDEEDPFGDIPDLSVDETQELQRLKAVAAKKREEANAAVQIDARFKESFSAHSANTQQQNTIPKATDMQSSEPTRVVYLTPGNTVPETTTRSTSWEDEHTSRTKSGISSARKSATHNQYESVRTVPEEMVTEDVEREISIHEDRVDVISQRRNVTISFSSPLASIIEPPDYHSHHTFDEDYGDASQSDFEDTDSSTFIIRKRASSQKTTRKTRTAFRSTPRHSSFGGHKFSNRPVSRIDEQDEDSINNNQRSLSVVSTPMPPIRVTSIALATPHQSLEIGNLSLTPLSEFTMRHGDESFGLDMSYIAKGSRQVVGNLAKRTLSLSIKDLVEKITQVEPYEPFWEQMKQLDLKDKRLGNLHKLDEFCEQLEDLDASHNQVSQLHGVPRTVRHLQIAHNCLSDMAAWGHLSNLQYVDVSNNDLESLAGFRTLVHLRSLKADNNKIKSLDGIGQLDGLLALRARGNLIETLNCEGMRLDRLTDLDLKENCITSARNLHCLQSLSGLNLEDNDLNEFSIGTTQVLWSLKYLKLGGNNLEKIDVSRYTNLRLLYLDRNRVGSVSGLLRTKHLDSLSMREQLDGSLIDLSFLSEALEVRKLFLSGNLLSTFQPQVDFLNLQYLELANCGLETLSPEFGHMLANVRVLNLNYNALRDIKPLHGIVRLKKLHLAGNRITRLRTTSCILSQFPTLSYVDLRNNPVTLGFYPPLTETRIVLHQALEDKTAYSEPFTLGLADGEGDMKYTGRLDMDTKLLRRAYEMLTLVGCRRLKMLDGLTVDRAVMDLRDKVWDLLVSTGVVKEVAKGQVDEENQQKEELDEQVPATEKTMLSDRWQAEDSFA